MPGYTIIYKDLHSGILPGQVDAARLDGGIEYTGTDGLTYRVTRTDISNGDAQLEYYPTWGATRKALADYYAGWRDSFGALTRKTRYMAEHELWRGQMPRHLQQRRPR